MSRKQTLNTNKSATVKQTTNTKTVTDYNALFESTKLKRIKEKGMATPPSMPQTRSERAFFESEEAVKMDTKKDSLAVQSHESSMQLLPHLPRPPQPPTAQVATIDRNEKGVQTEVCDDDEAGPADQTARGDSQIDDEVLQKIVQAFAQIPAFRNTQLPAPPSAHRQYSTQRSVTPQNPPEPLWFIPKTRSPKDGKSPAKSHRDKASGHAPHTPLPFVVHLNKPKDLSSSSSSSSHSPPKRRKVGQTLPKERDKATKKDKSHEKHKDEKGRSPEKQKHERGRPPAKQKDEKGKPPEKQKEEKEKFHEKQKAEKGIDHVKHPQDKDNTHEKHKDEEKRKSTRSKKGKGKSVGSKKEKGKTVQPKNEKSKSARDKKKHGSKKK